MSTRAAGPDYTYKPFEYAPDDPLAGEHAAVLRWVDEALDKLSERRWYEDVELKERPAGKAMLDAKPEAAKRYVVAAVAQLRHLDAEMQRVKDQAKNEFQRIYGNNLPGWDAVWGRRRQTQAVVDTLIRRSLPLEEADIIALIESCVASEYAFLAPVGGITRALQRYAADGAMTPALREAVRRFAGKLRDSHHKDEKRHATAVEQLLACGKAEAGASPAVGETTPATLPPPQPAPAGHAAVLDQLKRALGIPVPPGTEREATQTQEVGRDRFPLRADSPLRAEHAMLTRLFDAVVGQVGYNSPALERLDVGRRIVELDPFARGKVLLAAAERAVAAQVGRAPLAIDGDHGYWQAQSAAEGTATRLMSISFHLDRDGIFDFFLFVAGRHTYGGTTRIQEATSRLLEHLRPAVASSPLAEGERYVLHLLRDWLIDGPPLGAPSDAVRGLTELIGDAATFFLVSGEAWSDAVNTDLAALPAARRTAWVALLRHLLTATAARPAEQWLKAAAKLVEAAGGAAEVAALLARWFPLVNRGRTIKRLGAGTWDTRSGGDVMHEENATALRGMLWLVPTLKSPDLTRLVSAVALSAYRKVPGVGPRAVKVGNAAVYALSELGTEEAVGQLAMLKVRVKFGTAQKEIEKAFNAAAEALGLPRDQIEELGVPTYGLEEVGLRRETFGDFTAELRVDGRDAKLAWSRASDGKPQKSVPAKVKAEHKEELKELQQACKDVAAMLPAQAERIDSMFLLRKRWPIAAWRERYLDHPLVGTIGRRLIWSVSGADGGNERSAAWLDGRLVDGDDNPVEPTPETQVSLWHPIGRPMHDVLAWRAWLQRHQVRQPFKQAHREVYVLTDAERNTRTYSNRFAAHVLRQHQFNALCGARGWKNRLRLMVDDSYPPATKELPTFGLRAEYWVKGIGDEYGTDTTDSGAFLRLATDQVRFYRTGAAENYGHAHGGGYTTAAHGPGVANLNEPLPLEQIDPLAFSEVMRDVDLFVGVASVGNDPTWQDGGPGGRFQGYWNDYSFGELSATAQTRREVLAGLLPRLKIRDRATLGDRFLVVRGDIRTYKIHLGSGNILMEPNDQYLCIVPARSNAAPEEQTPDGHGLFLPFEGDTTLSVILSKAFLLAADKGIKDPTITRQIAI